MNSNQLLADLKIKGEAITAIIRNFKKDPTDRKTKAYFETRLERLQLAWTSFDETDGQLRALDDVPFDHEYFTSDYYENLRITTMDYLEIFKGELERLAVAAAKAPTIQQGAVPKQPSSAQDGSKGQNGNNMEALPSNAPTFQQGAAPKQPFSAHEGLISRAVSKMEALARQLRGLSFKPEMGQAYFEVKRASVSNLWQQVEALHDEVVDNYAVPADAGFDEERFIELEDESQTAIIRLLTAMKEQDNNRTCKELPAPPNSLPLPKVVIPRFDGDYLKWISFSDLFTRIIGEQPLSGTHKMWYLKTNLSGEAARLVSHLPVSEDNYRTAWNLLENRYNNKRLLVASAIDTLLQQPSNISSIAAIKRLHDTTSECLAALQCLDVNVKSWDPLLLYLLCKKLDKQVYAAYEQSITNPKELQTMEHFLAFLENHFHSLEAMGHKDKSPTVKTCAIVTSKQPGLACPCCKRDAHSVYQCKEFLRLNPSARLNCAQKNNLCINCLSRKHSIRQCQSLSSCRTCGKRHNTLLHLDQATRETSSNVHRPAELVPTQATQEPVASLVAVPKDHQQTLTTNVSSSRPYVLLGTARVKLQFNGRQTEGKAILDSGSQINLITEDIVTRLGLSPRAAAISINGIAKSSTKVQQRVNVELSSRLNNFSTQLEAFVLPRIIAPQPAHHINIDDWPIPHNIKLADPYFNRPEKVDILLGAEFYHQLLSIGQIRMADDLPILQNTTLGWMVSGKIASDQATMATCGVCTEDDKMSMAVEKFWQLEEINPTQGTLSPDDQHCEMQFTQTTERNLDGKFTVRLPFNNHPSALGDSHKIAFNRFLSLEKRLARDPTLRQQYSDFMDEYAALGHMTKVDLASLKGQKYFIPHHCVLRPESSSTKLRVVFDASAKSTSGLALNDILHTGPTLQNELFSVLLRFRMPRYVFTTDIEKMYRQILVHPGDRLFQIILWRKSDKDPISYYMLNTVTYGTRPAPYLATRCLKQLAMDNKVQYPLATEFVDRNFYVDDGLGGADSLATTLETQRQLQDLMEKHGFKLRKWSANHPQLLSNIAESDKEVNLDFSKEDLTFTKTLGLVWLPQVDQLRVKIQVHPISQVTKRTVTSDLARLFDPLGLLSPIVVRAKMFIQELWTLNLAWDEAVPTELDSRWRRFRNSLQELEAFRIQRHIYKGNVTTNTQLHVFTDASEKAYGAAIYVRTILKDKTIIVYLLCAKSRIAPLKKQTLPRLELCAAQLGALLATKVKSTLDMQSTPTHYWTDSTIVLAWINAKSSTFNTFVANRIASIHEVTFPHQWRHVSSKDNPADIISRGLEPDKLQQTSLWLYGPFFLHGTEGHWPPISTPNPEFALIETKRNVMSLVTTTTSSILQEINHRNCFKVLQRVIGYTLRFAKNARSIRDHRISSQSLTPIELHDALLIIVRTVQKTAFKDDITYFNKHKMIRPNSPLKNLTPFIDENGLLRVGGRLEASDISWNAKHPMLLPYDDPITKLIFHSIHKEHKHCGAQALLALVRQRFWPIKGKYLARDTVHNCIYCAKAKPQLLQQIMGNLPASRVTPARPFINSGVDYCGPIYVHYKTRGKRPQKAYIAVFCCFSTKAVHLELVTDLTTEAFLGALKRFISRRGHCQHIYCDNATNFVGARNQLSELATSVCSGESQTTIQRECSDRGIHFHFIPPRAPHFGGLWEAAVKSAKRLLVKELANASLTYEEMETVVVEAEAILNSRPISPMSSDPNDNTALTPGHFLIGEPLTAQVDATARPEHCSLARRWELVSRVKHHFWTRWSQEYLNELQQRTKWQTKLPNLPIGSLVVIKETCPVMTWRLGRVLETHPGSDGIVRAVTLKTSSGIIKRAIQLLAPLPLHAGKVDIPDVNVNKELNLKRKTPMKHVGSSPSKSCNLSAATSIMLVMVLLFPLALSQSVKYTKIEGNPGLHFEHIGQIKPVVSSWRLLIYYELDPFQKELQHLDHGTTLLEKTCKKFDRPKDCQGLVTHFTTIVTRMKEGLDNLRTRTKRGALNLIGNVANSLFGVLDSNYADDMTKTIESIKSNEANLYHHLKGCTSFLDSTLNIMKQTDAQNKAKFDELDFRINRVINLTSSRHSYESELMLSLSIQLMIVAEGLQGMHSKMINLLVDTHHGHITPDLLTPQQFDSEVHRIKSNLPMDLMLPAENILHLYGVAKVHAAVSSQHIICTMHIPLAHQKEYDLFAITPVPQIVNNSLMQIVPSTKLIGLNHHRDEYFPLEDTQLQDCDRLEAQTFLCPDIHANFAKGSHISNCEVHLFNNESSASCKVEIIPENNVWYQLHTKNHWIVATQGKLKLSTVCQGISHYQVLEETGLLTLPAGCTIKGNLMTIYSHQTISSSLRTSYVSQGMPITLPKEDTLSMMTAVPFSSNSEGLNSLQMRLKEWTETEIEPTMHKHSAHNLAVSYSALVIIIVGMLFGLGSCIRKRAQQGTMPVPQPRTKSSWDVSLEV